MSVTNPPLSLVVKLGSIARHAPLAGVVTEDERAAMEAIPASAPPPRPPTTCVANQQRRHS